MNNSESNLIRVNFDIPRELHRKIKARFASEGITMKDAITSFIEVFVKDVEPKGEETNDPGRNPSDNSKSLEERVGEIVEKKLAMKNPGSKLEEHTTKPMSKLEVHTVEPVTGITIPSEESEKKIKGQEPVKVEESIVREQVAIAENGLIAETVITGKKVTLATRVEAKKTEFKHKYLLGIPWWIYGKNDDYEEEEEKE